jgi:hypothetical protein
MLEVLSCKLQLLARTLISDNFLKICEIGGICGFNFRNLGLVGQRFTRENPSFP